MNLKSYRQADLGKHLLLIILAFLTYVPFWIMLVTSFKTLDQFYHSFWLPMFPFHFENYLNAGKRVINYILNSFIVTGSSVTGIIIISSLSAFAFARYNFAVKSVLFYTFVCLMMIPGVLTLVPAFVWMKYLNLINTRWVLILPYISGGQVFSMFILRGFFASLPEELFEAARVDGASTLQSYRHIAIPLSKPILSVIAIMNVLWTWNDYVWPLITIADDTKRTVTVGLSYFTTQFFTEYGPMMAGYTIASLPLIILFFAALKHFIRGLTAGALKM